MMIPVKVDVAACLLHPFVCGVPASIPADVGVVFCYKQPRVQDPDDSCW
jgi:hypothetical protein